MSTPLRPRTTTAFFVQSAISFAVSLAVTIIGIGYLHDSRWIRAFLALGLLYVVTSSFTLAKCIRDRQEETTVVSRVDQARLDKLLAEQDLLRARGPLTSGCGPLRRCWRVPSWHRQRWRGQVASAPWPLRCGGSSRCTASLPWATRPCLSSATMARTRTRPPGSRRWRSWPAGPASPSPPTGGQAGRAAWLIAADLCVAVALILSTRWIDTAARISAGAPTIPYRLGRCTGPGVRGGRPARGQGWRRAAMIIGAADLAEHPGPAPGATFNGIVLVLIAGGIGGYLVRLGLLAEERDTERRQADAAASERERIARGIHDSVLQVLALVSSRGRDLGGEAADLGMLAGEQEAALRALLTADSQPRLRARAARRCAAWSIRWRRPDHGVLPGDAGTAPGGDGDRAERAP